MPWKEVYNKNGKKENYWEERDLYQELVTKVNLLSFRYLMAIKKRFTPVEK